MAQFLETATTIAREAGALLNEFAKQRIGYELKGDYDLVTAADKASEKLIVDRLKSAFPTHSIVGEEGGGQDNGFRLLLVRRSAGRNHEFRPRIPGLQRVDRFGKSRRVDRRSCLRSDSGRAFLAERGSGAYLNGERFRVSNREASGGIASRYRIPQPPPSSRTLTSIFTIS